jgi:hypothetical protein
MGRGNDGGKSKGKGNKGDVESNETDDDFENILAELRASDPPNCITAVNRISSSSRSSTNSSSKSSSSGSSSTASGTVVTEALIIQASIRCYVTKLWQWAKRVYV